MRKLFVSLPMKGLDTKAIRDTMFRIWHIIEDEFDEKFELIDSVIEEMPPDDVDCGTWYLGKSINFLSSADICVFHPNWREARGCVIEHMICALYNLYYVDMSIDYDLGSFDNDVIDNTYDINTYGEINNAISEAVEKEELSQDDDVEDALGFEPDYLDDLSQDIEDSLDDSDIFTLEEGEYDADAQ